MDYKDLIGSYGSPLYVYDINKVIAAYQHLQTCLPPEAAIFYSVKANPHPFIIRQLYDCGAGVEVSSPGEIHAALQAGVAAERCLFTGPGKSISDLEFSLHKGIAFFSVESEMELRRIEKAADNFPATEISLLLRINPVQAARGISLTMMGKDSQFGIDEALIISYPERFKSRKKNVAIVGFHTYMGSNITTIAHLTEAFEIGLQCACRMGNALNIKPEVINLGGGFWHPFANNEPSPRYEPLQPVVAALLARYFPNHRPRFIFESGRFLVGASGCLATTVQDVKWCRNTQYGILDSGINHLGGMAGLRRVPRYEIDIHKEDKAHEPLSCWVLAGPLCTPLDVFTYDITTTPFFCGDIIVIKNVGAYSLTASLIGFLSFEPPVEICVLDGTVCEVSKLEINRKKIAYI
ncbi:hypothetical protein ACTJJ0_32605 [Chitinophaga sp. 22321]|uniref:Diaminopimelate decarboxylase n=1 Tax=Chitinophaga hostae TaxID=2831022 RepID=A0ABS5J991_9BACT|nr:hypothetical protein [Chitinophaga hostae]MBS0031779.1 hypothetical protein [Chitinophaga hostae]